MGFVPTMGALHRGHLSLLELAQKNSDLTVMSIFVNPAQFGPGEDLGRYPRNFDKDCALAQEAGCDIVFAPSVSEMYPQNYCTYVSVEQITDTLCGGARPGHFRGVCTVVLKFFNIVNPQLAVFGQKDAQQVVVIKRMMHDLNCSVQIEVGPVIREEDGLAMSSRNVFLTSSEREDVSAIYGGLKQAASLFQRGERNASVIREAIVKMYSEASYFESEYIELVDTVLLRPVDIINSTTLVAVACRTKESRTRLIDNIVLGGVL